MTTYKHLWKRRLCVAPPPADRSHDRETQKQHTHVRNDSN